MAPNLHIAVRPVLHELLVPAVEHLHLGVDELFGAGELLVFEGNLVLELLALLRRKPLLNWLLPNILLLSLWPPGTFHFLYY